MTGSRKRLTRCAWAAASLLLTVGTSHAGEGRDLFEGRSRSTATAMIADGVMVPVRAVACASCHGRDGRGGREAGIAAPAIVRAREGSMAPASLPDGYDRQAFSQALATGVAHDGRKLSRHMPRYQFDAEAVDGLWDYLGQLQAESQRGVEDHVLRFTVIGPPDASRQVQDISRKLNAALARLPRRFGRALEVTVEVWPDPALADGCPGAASLALVIPPPAHGAELLSHAARCGVPVIAPAFAVTGTEDARLVRAVFASLQQQWAALRAAAGPDLRVALPADMSEAEIAAAASLRGLTTDGRSASVLVPFGLDRLAEKPGPLRIFTTADHSARSLELWLAAGATITVTQVRSGTKPPDGVSPMDTMIDLVATLLDLSTRRAGASPTRSSLIASFDGLRVERSGWPVLDYARHRLTGTQDVQLLTIRP